MRIALLHFTAAPVIGGVERVMAEHARLLAKDGHEVMVLAGEELRGTPLSESLREAELVMAHNLLSMPFWPEGTRKLWRLAEADWGTRFIAWTHDVAAANPHYTLAPGEEGAIFRSCSPHFEYVAVSERRRRELHETMGVPLERCRVIPNGISPLEHWRVPKRWWGFVGKARLLERDLVFLHPARLVRRKAIELSLEVVAALRAAGKDVALLITAPEDPHQSAGAVYREELLRLRERLNLEREALFLNEVAPLEADDLSAFYELADAILFPSTQEGFGLPMLEAALHRVPIFCREIEPMTGLPSLPGTFFAPAASAEEVAAHLMRTLASSGTMKMRKQVIQTYGWAAIYRKCIAPLLQERLNFNRP